MYQLKRCANRVRHTGAAALGHGDRKHSGQLGPFHLARVQAEHPDVQQDRREQSDVVHVWVSLCFDLRLIVLNFNGNCDLLKGGNRVLLSVQNDHIRSRYD